MITMSNSTRYCKGAIKRDVHFSSIWSSSATSSKILPITKSGAKLRENYDKTKE